MLDKTSKLLENHVLLSLKCYTWDRMNTQNGLRHCRAGLSFLSTRTDRITSRPGWSVSAVQIFIGNHSHACFLEVSAHQQQKPCRHSELSLRAFSGCLDTFNNKRMKRGPRMHKTTTVRKIQRIATILEIWQKEDFFDSNYWQDRLAGDSQ